MHSVYLRARREKHLEVLHETAYVVVKVLQNMYEL